MCRSLHWLNTLCHLSKAHTWRTTAVMLTTSTFVQDEASQLPQAMQVLEKDRERQRSYLDDVPIQMKRIRKTSFPQKPRRAWSSRAVTASGGDAGVRQGRTRPVHTCLHASTSGTTLGTTGSWIALAWECHGGASFARTVTTVAIPICCCSWTAEAR